MLNLKITKAQARDTGMAMTLVALLLGNVFLKEPRLNAVAILILIITMTVPSVFKPAAVLWFGFSNLLGAIMSRVILSLVFFVVLTPIGALSKLIRKEPLKIKAFKKSKGSAFVNRNHVFSQKDLSKPY